VRSGDLEDLNFAWSYDDAALDRVKEIPFTSV
jgi:hypothetical protein